MGNIATVELILGIVALYAAVGTVFALAFLAVGLPRIDHGAKGAGWLFRVMILPGLIALWPLMLIRWISGGQPHGNGS